MKTQTNNLKKIAATACAALLIATGSYSQSDAGYSESELTLVNLETLVSLTEKAIMYNAPAVPESEVYYAEFERLNALADATEASLKYEAPEADENEVTVEKERLEWLAAATEASLKYEAPAADENEVTVEKERLEWLASATEASLKYNAPEADENSSVENQNVTMIASTK
jgi:hypothetical protein